MPGAAAVLVGSRREALALFRDYVETKPELLNDLHELDGKVLGCVCKPLPCHGDVLVELWFKHRLRKGRWNGK